MISYDLYKRGISIPDIAQERGMSEATINTHLIQLYEGGENIDINKFISQKELAIIEQVVDHMKPPFKLKDVFEALDGKITYEKIKFAFAHFARIKE